MALAANDARVRVAVAQNAVPLGKGAERQSFAPSATQQAAVAKLARPGQAPATHAAAVAMNDEEMRLAVAEYQPFRLLDQIPESTQILCTDTEKDVADWFVTYLAAVPVTH